MTSLKHRTEIIRTLSQCLIIRVPPTDEALLCFLPFCLVEISNFEADIAFFAERHDADTRDWLFESINKWFHAPGDSRAYVLLGDAGVGK